MIINKKSNTLALVSVSLILFLVILLSTASAASPTITKRLSEYYIFLTSLNI